MSVGISRFRNYAKVVNKISEKKPDFQINISKNLYHCLDSLADVNDADTYRVIMAKLRQAPDNIKERFYPYIFKCGPNSFSEFCDIRKFLKISCRKDENVKNYMIGLRDFLLNNPRNKKLINFVGTGFKSFISAFYHDTAYPVSSLRRSGEFTNASKDVFESLSRKKLKDHINEFFSYILNEKKK